MLFQEGPAETFGYMLLGFGVILGLMGLFVFSLLSRFRNLRKDLEVLEDVEGEEATKWLDS